MTSYKRITLTFVCREFDVPDITDRLNESLDAIHDETPVYSDVVKVTNARRPSDLHYLDELKEV